MYKTAKMTMSNQNLCREGNNYCFQLWAKWEYAFHEYNYFFIYPHGHYKKEVIGGINVF